MKEKDLAKQTIQKEKEALPEKKKQKLVITNHCKNCQASLGLDQQFCHQCGAKRIYNKLTARNLLEDFSERFLNIENVFLRTFLHLWTRPEDVINGYINGLRKRYMSAFSYFAVALTLGSLYIFVFRNWFIDDLGDFGNFGTAFNSSIQGGHGIAGETSSSVNVNNEIEGIIDKVFDFNSYLSFLLVPFYALISKIVFYNYKEVNFIEHIVIYLYAYSQTQIVSNILLILVGWNAMAQVIASGMISIFPFFYTAFVLYRVFDLTIEKMLLKTALFLAIFIPLGLLFFGSIGTIAYAMGIVDPLIDGVKEQIEVQKAAKAVKDSISTQDSIRLSIQKVKDSIASIKVIKDSLP